MATATATEKVGKVVQVIGPVVDLEFEGGHLPAIYSAVRIRSEAGDGGDKIDVIAEVEQHLGENRVRTVAMKPTDGMRRGMTAIDTGAADLDAGRHGHARSRDERARRAGRLPRPSDRRQGTLVDSPRRAVARGSVDRAADVRDRHQGRRPARAVPARRQDRAVRRRRRRQDRHHPGADPQRRHEARRRVGVRRRRRAHARGQRPLARIPGERRHQHEGPREISSRAGLRTDDRATRRPAARRAERPDRRRVFPRRREQGRAALHRQHLPLHAGGLRGVGAARPHAVAPSATSRRC